MSRSSARTAIRLGATVALAAVTAAGGLAFSQPAAAAGTPQNYIVLAPQGQGVANAVARVQSTGGTVLASYGQIGVLVARSDRTDFATAVLGAGVQSAAATTGLATRAEGAEEAIVAATPDPATTSEPLWPQQWDMQAIQVAEAHSVTLGSRNVVVGVLDSGVDATHPDLASQVDTSLSASCLGGVADPSFAAWQPTTSGHGTHVAGTIGAARNGIGVVGVAPGVRLAAVKVVDDQGFIFPEAAVCGYMWAATHGFAVTNNSYFIDPWEFNCRNDLRQRPIWAAVQRALRFSTGQGVLTVAAAGNDQFDLQHKFVDTISPDDGSLPPEERLINGACVSLPAEAPGVVTVSATGPTGLISFYSSYGLGVVEVAAPGGDSRVRGSEANGRVFSTIPGGGYGFMQGTSMASPHVVGVAALIRSLHPTMSPAAVTAQLERTADATACPAGGTYTPPGSSVTMTCFGSTANNGFYGHGEVNAFRAVTG
jgi:subtilisin family serine protease